MICPLIIATFDQLDVMNALKYILYIPLLCFTLSSHAIPARLLDSLNNELTIAPTPRDSIAVLFNIFDVAPRAQHVEILEQIYKLGKSQGDELTQLTAIRHLSNRASRNDNLYDDYLQRLYNISPSSEQQITKLFVKIKRNTQNARSATDSLSQERIRELMHQADMSNDATAFKQIEVLFTLCAYLEQFASGELLSEYMDQLGEALKQIEIPHEQIQNLYLSQRAITFTAMGDHAQAIAADKQLLEQFEHLLKRYRLKGRSLRNLSYNKYISYYRLLSNYKGLTNDEISLYYDKLKELADDDPVLTDNFYDKRLPDAYYLMSQKRYSEALPILIKELDNEKNQYRPPYLERLIINLVIEASQATGNKELLLKALLRSYEMTEREQSLLQTHQLRELQMLSTSNDSKLQEQIERNETLKHRFTTARSLRNYAIAIAVILSIFILVVTRLWRRTKSLNKEAAATNKKLTEERNILRQTQSELIKANERIRKAEKKREEFINNMSHEITTPLHAVTEYSQLITDCLDENKKPYLKRFVDVIKLNTELIQRLVNDVLDIAASDRNELNIDKKPTEITQTASIAADTFKHRLKEGVEFINLISPDPSLYINTDSKRVIQVLLNLLVNAAKFTEEGSITLCGNITDDGNCYKFSVTDTGIGIPAGKEEVIFERFEKLNKQTQGIGLGLSVSRLIATALGGRVYVDPDYKNRGARFIFIIPVK